MHSEVYGILLHEVAKRRADRRMFEMLQAQGYDTTIYLEPEVDYDCIMIASEVVQRIMTYLIIEPSTPELSKHNILLFFRLH